MAGRKGFTLIELIVVAVIVGLLAAFAIPNLINSIEQTKAQEAKNNLLAISAAQQKYFEDNGSYYYGASPIANLSLSAVANDRFSYNCSNASVPYQCTATDGTVTLTTTGSGVNCTVGGGYCPS